MPGIFWTPIVIADEIKKHLKIAQEKDGNGSEEFSFVQFSIFNQEYFGNDVTSHEYVTGKNGTSSELLEFPITQNPETIAESIYYKSTLGKDYQMADFTIHKEKISVTLYYGK